LVYKIRVQDENGKNYLISFDGLSRKLGVDRKIDYVLNRINKLHDEIVSILEPKAEQEILKLIREQPNIRTRNITRSFNMSSRSTYHAFWNVWNRLMDSDKIIGTSHGQGRNRTWRLKIGG